MKSLLIFLEKTYIKKLIFNIKYYINSCLKSMLPKRTYQTEFRKPLKRFTVNRMNRNEWK